MNKKFCNPTIFSKLQISWMIPFLDESPFLCCWRWGFFAELALCFGSIGRFAWFFFPFFVLFLVSFALDGERPACSFSYVGHLRLLFAPWAVSFHF